jgi:hypothetical protein
MNNMSRINNVSYSDETPVHYGDEIEWEWNGKTYWVQDYEKESGVYLFGEKREKKLRCGQFNDWRAEVYISPEEVKFIRRSPKGRMIALILDMDDDEFEKVKLVKIEQL